MKRLVLMVCAILCLSALSAAAESLCDAGEDTVFSCRVDGKTVSVCAAKNLSPSAGYIQYRFGSKDNIELLFPAAKLHPADFAEAGSLLIAGDTVSYLRLRNGVYSYVVYSSKNYDESAARETPKWISEAGVIIEKNNKKINELKCKPPIQSMLESDYLFSRIGFPRDRKMNEVDLPARVEP